MGHAHQMKLKLLIAAINFRYVLTSWFRVKARFMNNPGICIVYNITGIWHNGLRFDRVAWLIVVILYVGTVQVDAACAIGYPEIFGEIRGSVSGGIVGYLVLPRSQFSIVV